MLKTLGKAIQSRREALGLSHSELAQLAGVHCTYLADIELGRRNLTVRVLADISTALQVSMSELLCPENTSDSPTCADELFA